MIDWNNIDLTSEYERDLSLIDGLSFSTLLLEIDCNLRVISRETVAQQFKEDLESRVIEALEIFTANVDSIVAYAQKYREEK